MERTLFPRLKVSFLKKPLTFGTFRKLLISSTDITELQEFNSNPDEMSSTIIYDYSPPLIYMVSKVDMLQFPLKNLLKIRTYHMYHTRGETLYISPTIIFM